MDYQFDQNPNPGQPGGSPLDKIQSLAREHARVLSAIGLFFAGTLTGYFIGRPGMDRAEGVELASTVPQLKSKASSRAKVSAEPKLIAKADAKKEKKQDKKQDKKDKKKKK